MIQLKVSTLNAFRETSDPLAVFAFEDGGVSAPGLVPALRKQLVERAKIDAFKGKAGEIARVQASDGGRERSFILVGLGKRRSLKAEGLRKAGGALSRYAKRRFKSIGVLPAGDAQALGEGLLLASYRFAEYLKPEEDAVLAEAVIVAAQGSDKARLEGAARKAGVYADAVCFARDLVNRGPSDKTPEQMGKVAQGLAGSGISVDIISPEEAKKLGMGSYLSVARGSAQPPCFVHLTYKPKGARRKIGLVGKGITFDSGGLSLKPPQSMEDMKCDMAGAAAVLGAFKALASLKLKVEVHGFCAFTYNMPGPDATKPGDVVRAMNGKTIEILNTDAEGRLVLADALVYATKQGLDAMIDAATLTGAAVIALGSKVSAAMTNNPALLNRVVAASKKAGEDLWELPLVPEYLDGIKGNISDLRNISKVRGEAGTIIGGLFLQEFVDGKPWVHLDIAGPAFHGGESDYCPAGGTGVMVRTFLEYLAAV
ncbi:MAG: leucyl aminopeptidase [Elusimicrobia bacterium]|nr:leucyl aminopeptidase [Elusimicrobiota bacterium]